MMKLAMQLMLIATSLLACEEDGKRKAPKVPQAVAPYITEVLEQVSPSNFKVKALTSELLEDVQYRLFLFRDRQAELITYITSVRGELSETRALSTPSRWSYTGDELRLRDVGVVKLDDDGERAVLEMENGARVELRMQTDWITLASGKNENFR